MNQTPFDQVEESNPISPVPPSQPVAPVSRRNLWLGLGAVLLVVLLASIGLFRWTQARDQQAKTELLRSQLRAVALADNALVLEVLEMDDSSHITYAEFFKRTEKNKENRDDLVRRIRAIEAGPFAEEAANFVRLMEVESEFVRAEEDVAHQSMKMSSAREAFDRAATSQSEALQDMKISNDKYLQAPYGEDYGEKLSLEMAQNKAESAQSQVKSSLDELKKNQDELRQKIGAAKLAVDDWLRQEKVLYPSFAPPRDITSLLIKRKTKYGTTNDVASDKTLDNPKATVAAVPNNASQTPIQVEIKPAPTATPQPLPQRLKSTEAFAGEQFPETRLRRLDADEVSALSDESLRYAINEMYARYGMTFKDKDYQASFEPWKWYRPDDKWKPGQIERAFTATEKANSQLLAAERNARSAN